MLKIEDLHGRVNDLDSHLEAPVSAWGSIFGDEWAEVGRQFAGSVEYDCTEGGSTNDDERAFWTCKGPCAPGLTSPEERVRVLDAVGIDKQVIFPQLFAFSRIWNDTDAERTLERRYNEATLRWRSQGKGRLFPAATLRVHDLRSTIAEVEHLVATGVAGIFIPDGTPIAGFSPAHPDVDPIWAALAATGTPLFLHIGGANGFIDSAWRRAPSLEATPERGDPADRFVGPHLLGTMHLSACNFVTAMIFGGVFERHPTLRMGVIEQGAMWMAPLADLLDTRQALSARLRAFTRRPSEVFTENIRVTPFYWEPTRMQIERYGMESVYAFSSDFPHPEGGTTPLETTFADLAPLGDEVLERFFVTNAELLLAAATPPTRTPAPTAPLAEPSAP